MYKSYNIHFVSYSNFISVPPKFFLLSLDSSIFPGISAMISRKITATIIESQDCWLSYKNVRAVTTPPSFQVDFKLFQRT